MVKENSRQDEHMILRAVDLACEAVNKKEGGPFAALIVQNGQVIAQGWNRVPSSNDPTAHAEIEAIRRACLKLRCFHLEGCVLYTSCEPCPMCWGAIQWSRVQRVVYAATRDDAARGGFDDRAFHEQMMLPMTKRSPHAHHFPLEKQLEPFRLWTCQEDRIAY